MEDLERSHCVNMTGFSTCRNCVISWVHTASAGQIHYIHGISCEKVAPV